jgi:hypothetical protein
MAFFKKKLTEHEAASFFVVCIMKWIECFWPSHSLALKARFGERWVFQNERMVVFDLLIAAATLDLQAVGNLFPKDQAERIGHLVPAYIVVWVLKYTHIEDWGNYVTAEVQSYTEDFHKEMASIDTVEHPLTIISSHLLHRWLGENVRDFETVVDGEETGYIDLGLVMMVTGILYECVGTWKSIIDRYRIVEAK